MISNQQHSSAAAQNLRDTIRQRGWKEIAQFITSYIEFVTDLCRAGQLADSEQDFVEEVQITIGILAELRDGKYEEEVHRLCRAVQAFNRAQNCRRDAPEGSRRWSLTMALAQCGSLDESRRSFEQHCDVWRGELDGVLKNHRKRALQCIEEIEKRILIFRSTRLADLGAQQTTFEQLVLLDAKLTVYADHPETLQRFSNRFVPADCESEPFERVAAVSEAVLLNDLSGKRDWLEEVAPFEWIRTEIGRRLSIYQRDGRLDSNNRVIHETAYVDPLYRDTGEVLALGTDDKFSFEVAEHPDVHQEVEDLEAAFKKAGLNPSQRRALLMRSSGKIMSHHDVKEWRRSQRAIGRNQSALVKAISEATKVRVIKAPLISGGSHTGVIREGGSYSISISGEDKPPENPPKPIAEETKWFDSNPPPICCTTRKQKHLFKKVST